MNINDAFPSKYLKETDLKGKTIDLIMTHVEMETIGTDTKPVVYFQGKDKGLMLNKINASVITKAYSPETNGWTGKPIQIYPTTTEFKGEMVPCIRARVNAVIAQPVASEPKAQTTVSPVPHDDFDDDIPF